MSTDDIQSKSFDELEDYMNLRSDVDIPNVLELPSYDDAYRTFLESMYQGYAKDNELLGGIAVVRDRHCGPIRNVRDAIPLDQSMISLSVGVSVQQEAMRTTNLDEYILMLHKFACDMIETQTQHLLTSMGAVSDAAGMTVPNDGLGIPTLEQFRELLQRMDLNFDDEGKLQQRLFVHSSQADKATAILEAVKNDPECMRIVAEKKMKWMELSAARSHRTLHR